MAPPLPIEFTAGARLHGQPTSCTDLPIVDPDPPERDGAIRAAARLGWPLPEGTP